MQHLLDYFSFKHFLLTIEGFVNLTYKPMHPNLLGATVDLKFD